MDIIRIFSSTVWLGEDSVTWARIAVAVIATAWGCISLIKSGIRPDIVDPLKWYDRTLRIVGGLIMGFFCVGIVIMAITGRL